MLMRHSEAIKFLTALGLHIRMVECSPTRTTSTTHVVAVVDNAARSDNLALHSAVLTCQWNLMEMDCRIITWAVRV